MWIARQLCHCAANKFPGLHTDVINAIGVYFTWLRLPLVYVYVYTRLFRIGLKSDVLRVGQWKMPWQTSINFHSSNWRDIFMKYPSNFLTTVPPISTENPPSVMPDEVSHILRPDLSQNTYQKFGNNWFIFTRCLLYGCTRLHQCYDWCYVRREKLRVSRNKDTSRLCEYCDRLS